jgi:hypothetical protein
MYIATACAEVLIERVVLAAIIVAIAITSSFIL